MDVFAIVHARVYMLVRFYISLISNRGFGKQQSVSVKKNQMHIYGIFVMVKPNNM